jgi:hypothetical protein
MRLNPDKTKVVYCKDGDRRGSYEHTSFTFLGFTFRARKARNKAGKNFTSFLPAISKDVRNKISGKVRRWRLHRRTGHSFAELARTVNPIGRGWIQYYGAFYRSALYPFLQSINAYLVRWIRKKYKRLRPLKKALACWRRSPASTPGSSSTGHGAPPPGDQDDKSRMTGGCQSAGINRHGEGDGRALHRRSSDPR